MRHHQAASPTHLAIHSSRRQLPTMAVEVTVNSIGRPSNSGIPTILANVTDRSTPNDEVAAVQQYSSREDICEIIYLPISGGWLV